MDFFQGVDFVRLRSWEYDSYLVADEDGRSVQHENHCGASRNSVWAVQALFAGAPPEPYLLFRGAYGRFLGARADATERCCGCCPLRSCLLEAAQRERDEEEVDAIMWRAIGCGIDVIAEHGASGVVLLHDRSWRYLRAYERIMGCFRCVSVDGRLNDEKTLRWEVVPVPPSPERPELPIAIADTCWDDFFSPLEREIRFVTADDDGNFDADEEGWDSFQFTGRSVANLRKEFQVRLGNNYTLCVRAGHHGQVTLLLIDLPRSRETLHIVLFRPNSAVDELLISPDLDALSLTRSEDYRRMIE
ncbi:uncharacterized protein LOC102705742 [Oryza brachyantha]|uniref:Uncharacterized protein n=1 Tax=Oryza brachyantha TaxID=4533 RepID=J3MQP0_ORYBR|nr:uncharacterized protein LOC102705742 [Oryza brachyantha]